MSNINFTLEERSVVIGSLLGDGYITNSNSLQIEHAFKQAEYVRWKYRKLQSIAGKTPRVIARIDTRNRKTYHSIRFYTRCVMHEFKNMFYKNGKRIVPSNLIEVLDDLALAVWFMDDGSKGAHTLQGVVFNTSGFSKDEQFYLQNIFKEKFNIKVNIHHVGKGYHLYITSGSYQNFYDRISPYIIPQMRYKLVDPVTTEVARPRW